MNFPYNFDIELREFAHKLDVDDETKSEIKKMAQILGRSYGTLMRHSTTLRKMLSSFIIKLIH